MNKVLGIGVILSLSLFFYLACSAAQSEPDAAPPPDLVQELDPDQMLFRDPLPSYETVTFSGANGEIRLHLNTGQVEWSDGMTLDEAAREFWLALAGGLPGAKAEICR